LEAGGGREGSPHVMHVVTLRTENSSERAKPIAVAVWDHPRSNDTEKCESIKSCIII
jgi:hypothetical protein